MPLPERVTIDRFEDNGWAVLEYGPSRTLPVPGAWLPDDASEGDVLRLTCTAGPRDTQVRFILDTAAVQARRSRIRNKLDQLRERGTDNPG